MTQKHEHMLNSAQPHSAAVLRNQQIMHEVQQALQKSQAMQDTLQQSIQASWGCSQQGLEKKLTAVFGEPTEQQLLIARKALEDHFYKHNTLVPQKVQKPFVVHNPI